MPAIRSLQGHFPSYTPGMHRAFYDPHMSFDPTNSSIRNHHSSPDRTRLRFAPSSSPYSVSPHPYHESLPTASSQLATVVKPKKKKSPNAFILYRSEVLSRGLLPKTVTHQNTASIMIADLWKVEPDDVKKRYYAMAAERKRVDDEAYARACGLSEMFVRAPKKGRKRRPTNTIDSDTSYLPTSSPHMSPAQDVLFTPPFHPTHPLPGTPQITYPDFARFIPMGRTLDYPAFSPCSSAESCFPPTPALSSNALSPDFPTEFFGVIEDHPLSTPEPSLTYDREAVDSIAPAPTSEELQKLMNELFPSPEAEPQIPFALDDTPFEFNVPSPNPLDLPVSTTLSDSEAASWARVQAFIDTHPNASVPGIGFTLPLLEESIPVPQCSLGSTSSISHSVYDGEKGADKKPAGIAGQAARPTEISKATISFGVQSAGWCDAFKEFATGKIW